MRREGLNVCPIPHCKDCDRRHENERQILVQVRKYFDRNPPTDPLGERIVQAANLWFDCRNGPLELPELDELPDECSPSSEIQEGGRLKKR